MAETNTGRQEMMKTSDAMTRREFLATATVAGTALLASPSLFADATRRRRYALVGVGHRSTMYREAVLKSYAEHAEMVSYCDLNAGRLKLAQTKAREMAGIEVPLFEARDFDRMIRETRPDVVIVTTKDGV